MVELNRFIAEQNVAHYRDRLHMGAEPETRAVVLKLLLAEEETLGRTRERLARIDRHIEKLQRIIAQQQKRIDRLMLIGVKNERATQILTTLNDLMQTYQLHRQWITAGLADGSAV